MEQSVKKIEPLYLEDLNVGQRFVSGTYQMEEQRMKAFAEEFDPQPFHLDEAAGKASFFGGLAASGWHPAAATMRLWVNGGMPFASGIIGFEGQIAWPRPTRAGDTLRVESEILEIAPSRSKPDRGVVLIRTTTTNQHSEPGQTFTVKVMVFRR